MPDHPPMLEYGQTPKRRFTLFWKIVLLALGVLVLYAALTPGGRNPPRPLPATTAVSH